ncbi:MAG: DUF4332 domain-containing protein [Chloroflexota bacterium]
MTAAVAEVVEEPEPIVEEVPQAEVVEAQSVSSDPDDLTKIEGIGKKMSSALIKAGIDTFAKLSQATEDQLRQAIKDAGMRFAPSLVTWAEQAEFAAKGDWDGLEALQDQLEGGRRVD